MWEQFGAPDNDDNVWTIGKTVRKELPPGYISNLKVLLRLIMQFVSIDRTKIPIKLLRYDPNNGRVSLHVTPGYKIQFSTVLSDFLGLHDGAHRGSNSAKLPPQFGFKLLYVYSDLIEEQEVGGQRVPLLATVAVKGEHSETIVERIHDPFYIGITKRVINRIELQLSRDNLEPIEVVINIYVNLYVCICCAQFVGGKVVATLHIRPKNRWH